MANPCTPTAVHGAMFCFVQRILDAGGSFTDDCQSGEDDENSLVSKVPATVSVLPPHPGEELLLCVQKQIMDKLSYTWDNFAICVDRFLSLSEHEKTKIMDDCVDGFKELVALHFGTSSVRRLDIVWEADVRHAFRPQLQGYECHGRHGGEVWCGLFQSGRSVDAMPSRLARPRLEHTTEPPSQSSGELWRMSFSARMRRRSTRQCSDTTWWSTRLRSLTAWKCFQLHGPQLRAKSWWLSTASTRTVARRNGSWMPHWSMRWSRCQRLSCE